MLWFLYLLMLTATICNTQSILGECEIRLWNDTDTHATTTHGVVELKFNSTQWIRICDDGWTNDTAQVVCRSLNLPDENVTVHSSSWGVTPDTRLLNLSCFATEEAFLKCLEEENENETCATQTAVEIQCDCMNKSARLTNGSESEGLLEVCYNSEWGLVCDDWWDEEDNMAATVACQNLGYKYGKKLDICAPDTATEGKTFILDDVSCAGGEPSLFHCDHIQSSHNCILAEAVYIKCYPSRTTKDIRLVQKINETSGLVEVRRDGEWKSVCDDCWATYDAMVACRELGFSPYFPGSYNRGEFINETERERDYWLDDVNCTGREERLFDCWHLTPPESHNCDNKERAGVHCLNTTELEIRLTENSSGIVEVRVREEWGYICNEFWTNDDANVVCNQLGYKLGGRISHEIYKNKKGEEVKYWMYYVDCKGNETSVFGCLHITCGWNCNGKAGVICYGNKTEDVPTPEPPEPPEPPSYIFSQCAPKPIMEDDEEQKQPSGCADDSIQLVKSIEYDHLDDEGLVQICKGGEWRYVCNDYWDVNDARVVCKVLNMLTDETSVSDFSYNVMETYVHYWLDDVQCTGNESSLSNCSHLPFGGHNCGPNERAAVKCNGARRVKPAVNMTILGKHIDYIEKENSFALGANSTVSGENQTIYGSVKFTPTDNGIEVKVSMEGLADNVLYEWGISKSTIQSNQNQSKICPTEAYDPDNNAEGMCNYKKDCVNKDPSNRRYACPAGDYSTRFLRLNGAGRASITDDRLTLTDLIGRFVYIYGGGMVACGAIIPELDCDEGDILMTVVAKKLFLGPLEVCARGKWHRVCDIDWNKTDSMVACKQLELPYNGAVAVYFNKFDVLPSNNLDYVTNSCDCKGDEDNLYDCIYANETVRQIEEGEKVSGAICQQKI